MKHRCTKCDGEHEIYYVVHKDNTKHVVMRCFKNIIYVPKVSNDLDLEVKPTRGQLNDQRKTGSLF